MEGVEQWDIPRRAQAMVLVQMEAGADFEVHLFPAAAAKAPPPGSFADFVLRHGAPLDIESNTSTPE